MMEQQGAEIEGEKGDVSPSPPVGVNNKNKKTTHVEEDTRKPAVEKNDLERDDDEGVVVVESPPPPSLIIKSNNKKSVRWSQDLVTTTTDDSSAPIATSSNPSNVYFSYSLTFQDSVSVIKDVLARWGNKVGEATRKAEDLSKNTWQHLNTAPSFADAALGRIAQGTKVLAEGGYEKIFRQTFETISEEQLQNSFACYLSTSAGPVMGVMYLSTAKLAFSSDNPISYKSGDKTEWSYYKVVIPLHQLKAVNPSTSRAKSAEKFIQVISMDNHEFWYMGFLNYENAVHCMQEALQLRDSSA